MTTKKLTDYIKQQTPIQHASRAEQVKPAHARIRFKKETEFQETPIGKIPKEWRIGELHDLGELVDGFAFPPDYQGKKGLKYLFVKVSDTNIRGNEKYIRISENTIDDDMANQLGVKIYPPGTIIFPKIGEVIKLRKVRILAKHGTFDNNIIGIIPSKETVNGEFLYYYILGRVDFTRLIGGSTAPALRKSVIAKIKIALPPPREQVEIVRILSSVDYAIEKVGLLVERAERLKKGLMQELLTKGIGHKEYKETPIGKIPREWQVVKLGSLCQIRHGKRPEKVLSNGSYPIYGAGGFSGYTMEYLSEGPWTIIIGRVGVGSVGKVYIVPGRVWVNDNAFYIQTFASKAHAPFIYYVLLLKDLKRLAMRSAGGYAIITQTLLKEVEVPLPPLEEQIKIAELLRVIDSYIEKLKTRLEHLENIKKSLMDVLLTGKVRVIAEPS